MDKQNLTQQHCVPCEGGAEPLKGEELKNYISYVPEWEISGEGLEDDGKGKKLSRTFKFKDFRKAMEFVNRVADITESEGHHPDIYIIYNKVTFDLSTHAIGGLSTNDFILATKIDDTLK